MRRCAFLAVLLAVTALPARGDVTVDPECGKGEQLKMVEFYSCGRCQGTTKNIEFGPPLYEVRSFYPHIQYERYNIAGNPQLADQYGVHRTPALVIVRKEKVLRRLTGRQDRDALIRFIQNELNPANWFIGIVLLLIVSFYYFL